MNGAAYKLARGVRLGRDPAGEPILLVPEGIVELNDTAAATLETIDGRRTLDEVVRLLGERFETDAADVRADVEALLTDLAAAGFVNA